MSELSRKQQAFIIISEPGKYKICHGCGSIVTQKVQICPACHHYRFDFDSTTIIKRAAELAEQEQETVLPEDFY